MNLKFATIDGASHKRIIRHSYFNFQIIRLVLDEVSENLYKILEGACNYIKSSLLICEIHHNLESNIDEQVCKECENMLLKGPGSVY